MVAWDGWPATPVMVMHNGTTTEMGQHGLLEEGELGKEWK